MGLHTAEELDSDSFRVYWGESTREIADKGDLSAYWIILIAFNIAGRSQAPEKVDQEGLEEGDQAVLAPADAAQAPPTAAPAPRTMSQRMTRL
ncbi:hypothetical protein Tco_0273887 [Tanacetum coccineum]